MDLPFMLGQGFLNPFQPTTLPLALGLTVVGTVVYFWWLRRITSQREYRSFRATTHGGVSQAAIALGVTLSVGAALILIAPVIASMIRT